MRGPRITINEAARGYSVASSSRAVHASQSLRSLQARCLSTNFLASTEAISPPPPAFLQNIIKDSLRPSFQSSALLSNGPKLHAKPNSKRTKRQVPPVHAANNVKTSAPASTSGATSSTIYNNRSQMIIRLIRNNRILSAMAAFNADVADPNRAAYSPKELEDLVLAMRIQTKRHATSRPAPKLNNADPEQDLWTPTQLDPSVSAKSLSIPAQCMYAMATIYDVALERKYQPTAKMVSAMLSTFVGNLSPEQMEKATETALDQLVPPTAADQESHLRMISHYALSTFIHAFGRIGKPEKGEELLDRWAKAQRSRLTDKPATLLHADEIVDLTGWGQNVVLWHSLIQARADAMNVIGARAWLDRYRLATKKTTTDSGIAPPVQSKPYLAYMNSLRNRLGSDIDPNQINKTTSAIRDTVQLMLSDNVEVDSAILAFIVSYEAQVGNVEGGASLVEELSSIIEADALCDADLLRALLQIRSAALARKSGELKGVPSTRALIRSLIRIGEGDARTTQSNLASCRSRGTLNIALETAMAEHDYPAAIVVLNLFERWRQSPSHTTYSIVLDALVAQGHHVSLSANAEAITASPSVTNLNATLVSMAREGNGQQADLIRRALGDQLASSETVVVSSKPDHTLRQTQYLVRVLNRVCAAEVESEGSGRNDPSWLTEYTPSGHPDAPMRHLTEEYVTKRVRYHVYRAQDELLGPRETRKQLPISQKSPLFTPGPTISPRRRGWQHPGQRRAFSTSAVPETDSSAAAGASCDLAAAASKDFTHLDPVRTIYIPGFVPYSLGLALQEHLVKQRANARAALRVLGDSSSSSASTLSGHTKIESSEEEAALQKQASQDTLLLLQHRPVYTEGRREEAENELVANHLRSLGADYFLTKRGGQITYHGPGQLVGYPILNLSSMNLASRCYVDKVQDSLISLLAQRGIEAVEPPDSHTGVWADEYHKIASIGIQVRHRISSHGFALNVEKRAMKGFRHIVACGIVGRNMTCLQDRLDPEGPFAKYNKEVGANKEEDVQNVARSYTDHFAKVFGRRVRDMKEEEFVLELGEEQHRDSLMKGLQIEVKDDEKIVTGIRVDGQPVVVA